MPAIWEPTFDPNDPSWIIQLKTWMKAAVEEIEKNRKKLESVFNEESIYIVQITSDIDTTETGYYDGSVWYAFNEHESSAALITDTAKIRLVDGSWDHTSNGDSVKLVAHAAFENFADGSLNAVYVASVNFPATATTNQSGVMGHESGAWTLAECSATGTFFLASVDGVLTWIQSDTCVTTTTAP